MDPRLAALEVVDGLYLGMLVFGLHEEGVLQELAEGKGVAVVAEGRGYDAALLRSVLEFLARKTGLVEQGGAGDYRVAPHARDRAFGSALDMYIGAYGECVRSLRTVLRDPARGSEFVDHERFALAWQDQDTPSFPLAAELVLQSEPDLVVDVGSGSGALLVALARARPSLRAIGLENSPEMLRVAAGAVTDAGLSDRVRFLRSSVSDVDRVLDDDTRDAVDVVHCGSLLNAFFRTGGDAAVRCLNSLGRAFPGRLLVVADYYGKLGHPSEKVTSDGRGLTHDLVQAMSGQGIPAPDLDSWRALYVAADAVLLYAWKGSDGGLDWFVHLVGLPEAP